MPPDPKRQQHQAGERQADTQQPAFGAGKSVSGMLVSLTGYERKQHSGPGFSEGRGRNNTKLNLSIY